MRVIDIWSICSGLQIISPKQFKIIRCCSINIKDISLIDPFVDFYSVEITLPGQIKTLIGHWVIENNISTTIIGSVGIVIVVKSFILIGKTNHAIISKVSIHNYAMIGVPSPQFNPSIIIYQNISSNLNGSCSTTISYLKNSSIYIQASDRKSTRLNSSHVRISYAVLFL